jgi:4-hydroxy-3-polyprenylbenzoate decarboxylase
VRCKCIRLVVGVSGGSGVVYGIRFLEVVRDLGIETHAIVSPAAKVTIKIETNYDPEKVESLASKSYRFNDVAASVSSGSFKTDGMVIMPCSMKTAGGLAAGYADNLVLRAAEVTMKERRPLIIVPRETPLTTLHLRNLLTLSEAGVIVVPAMPAFYHNPKNIQDIIDHLVGKVLDLLRVEHNLFKRWQGL